MSIPAGVPRVSGTLSLWERAGVRDVRYTPPTMRELALVVGIMLGLLGLGALAQLPFELGLHWGLRLTALGLAVLGVPTLVLLLRLYRGD